MKREKKACTCKNVTYGMIEDAIRLKGAKAYDEVENMLRFGTGCGKCKEFLWAWGDCFKEVIWWQLFLIKT